MGNIKRSYKRAKQLTNSGKIEKYSAEYWAKEITRSQEDERMKTFLKFADESVKLYARDFKLDDVLRSISTWWFCTNTLMPAYYSNTPKVEVELRKSSGKLSYQQAALIIERATQYGLDEFFDFDSAALSATQQLLLCNREILWVRYEADIDDEEQEVAYQQHPDTGEIVDINGNPYEGDSSQLQESPEGLLIDTVQGQTKTDERALIESIHYRDFLTSVARNESEVEWKARRAYLSEDEAQEKFGADVSDKMSYDCYPEDGGKSGKGEPRNMDGKAELWEIHCEESNKVYFLQATGEKKILESSDPPIKFEDFYPCVDLSTGTNPNTTVPTSDYQHCRDLIMEVERLTTRIHACIQAFRINFGYDAALGDNAPNLFSGDFKGIPIKNWPQGRGKGGISTAFEFIPTDPYVQGLQTLTGARQDALDKLFEHLKVSDILRGATDPNETATAQQLKSNWSFLGLEVRQKVHEKFLSNAISKFALVICQQFSIETIFEMGNVEELLEQGLQPQTLQEIAAIIQGEADSKYRIQITSDSIVALDQKAERTEKVDLMQSYGSFINQTAQFCQQFPPAVQMVPIVTQFVLRSYRAGKELEEPLMQMMQEVTQFAAQQGTQQLQAQAAQTAQQSAQGGQQAPPPLSPDMQAKLQIAQMNQQSTNQKLQFEQWQTQLDAQMKTMQAQLDYQKLQLEGRQLDVQAQESNNQAAIAATVASADEQRMQTELTKELLDTQQAKIGAQADIVKAHATVIAAAAKPAPKPLLGK